jgi:hypothetical protein
MYLEFHHDLYKAECVMSYTTMITTPQRQLILQNWSIIAGENMFTKVKNKVRRTERSDMARLDIEVTFVSEVE